MNQRQVLILIALFCIAVILGCEILKTHTPVSKTVTLKSSISEVE